jgi:hypothetical protein
MSTWLPDILAALDALARAPDADALKRASDKIAELTTCFDTFTTTEQQAIAPQFADVLTRLALTTETLNKQQTELAAELTNLRTRATALNAYGSKR